MRGILHMIHWPALGLTSTQSRGQSGSFQRGPYTGIVYTVYNAFEEK